MPNLCKKIIVIHYGEIALKGRNRIFFENKLKTNIKKALPKVKIKEIERLRGRLVINLAEAGRRLFH